MKSRNAPLFLVAGGAGFIGSHLIEALLSGGARVVCIDNFLTGREKNLRLFSRDNRFELIEWDISRPVPERLLRRDRAYEAIFNLACAASPPHYQADPEHTMLTCVVGTHQLLRLAETSGARFVQASTSEVYGDPESHPQSESYWGHVNPTGPRACYDEGKRAAEALIFDYDRLRRADSRVARIFNTYGPRMREDDGRVVSNTVCQALSGESITIYGDGRQTRSFCYVSDLVEGLLLLARHRGAQPGPINLGNPNELMIRELVDLVVTATDSRSPIVRKPLPVDDPQRRRPDIARAQAVLGWSPRVPLREGLAKTVEYFRAELASGAQIFDRTAPAPGLAKSSQLAL